MDNLTLNIKTGSLVEFPSADPDGNFIVGPGSLLDFAPLIGSVGTVQSLQAVPGSVSVDDFVTFLDAPELTFTLTEILPGVLGTAGCSGGPTAGQTCTPVGSAFNFINTTASSSTLSFTVQGTVSDGSASLPSNFQGVFQTTFAGRSFQQVLLDVALLGESGLTAASANFAVTAIPEPGTTALIGLGLAGILWLRRRMR